MRLIVRALHMTAPRGVPASLVLFRTDKASYREVNTSKELCMKYLFHQFCTRSIHKLSGS